VLFLDELPEFDRRSLEALRQVLETRQIVLARARTTCVFPAHFQLVAAANPCPCGWWGSGRRDCRCDAGAIARYESRISGPLLDRVDLHLSLQPITWEDLDAAASGEESGAVRARVIEARRKQRQRAVGSAPSNNVDIPDSRLDAVVRATAEARRLLGRAVDRLGLSARGARRTLKVARTIADLAGDEETGLAAVAEALSYRAGSADLTAGM